MKLPRFTLLALAIVTCQCSERDQEAPPANSTRVDPVNRLNPNHRFQLFPLGKELPESTIEKTAQPAGSLSQEISNDNFLEVTIGQGSGWKGFDVIRIFKGGSGYAVFSPQSPWGETISVVRFDEEANSKASFQLDGAKMDRLLVALNADELFRIDEMYHATSIQDGVQGFVEIKTTEGIRRSWLSNYFDLLANTYRFMNDEVWPSALTQPTEETRIDRQDEYHRVFEKK